MINTDDDYMGCNILPELVPQMKYVPENVMKRIIAAVEADVAEDDTIVAVDYEHIAVFDLGKKYEAYYNFTYDAYARWLNDYTEEELEGFEDTYFRDERYVTIPK